MIFNVGVAINAVNVRVAIGVSVVIGVRVLNSTVHVLNSRHLHIIKSETVKDWENAILVVEVVMNCIRQLLIQTVPRRNEV